VKRGHVSPPELSREPLSLASLKVGIRKLDNLNDPHLLSESGHLLGMIFAIASRSPGVYHLEHIEEKR